VPPSWRVHVSDMKTARSQSLVDQKRSFAVAQRKEGKGTKIVKPIRKVMLAAIVTCLGAISVPAQASDLLFSQLFDGQSVFGPSDVWTPSNVDREVSDDFDVVGSIDRVVAEGSASSFLTFRGVYVRFYEYLPDGTPGLVPQKEYFFTTGYDAGTVDVTLSPAFAATGKHFLSVQPVIDGWYWWSANTNAPHGTNFYYRDNANGDGVWRHDNTVFYPNSDVAFALYGTVGGAGNITALSATTLERSGYLEITGTNFGSDGTVLVDGVSAPVADWQSTKIVAYVPESTRLATVPVQMVNASGIASNTLSLTVTARQAAGRVNWRFRQNGPYSLVRPAIGPDGTIYSVDAFDHLYALTPDGGLKWLVRAAGGKGVALGPDGTIYAASESLINAYNPDGSAKWTFVQNPRALTNLGVSVGPDGNIYSVGTQGMGVFSLTPAGTLRWTNPELYRRPIVDYGEIVFGPNGTSQQLYFSANTHMRAVGLDGSSVFTVTRGQPAVAPDGSVHTSYSSYAPNGSLNWTFDSPYPHNVSSEPDIGSDGIHYFVENTIQLFALNTNGSQKWHLTLADYVGGPVVDPQNTQLLLGSAATLNFPGYIIAASAQDGHELWRVNLPAEAGFNQSTDTRARFTPDGLTAYFMTYTATGDNDTSRSFVYSLNAAGTTAIMPTSVVSRKTHGAAGTFDISLPLTGSAGIECRSGGPSSTYQTVFSFAKGVTLSGATVTPGTGGSGNVVGSPIVSPDGKTVTVNLTGVTNVQTITVTLTNVSDGTATNNVPILMGVLIGDTSADRTVNSTDISQTRAQVGQAVTTSNFRSDVTTDGVIRNGDVSLVKTKRGTILP